MKEDIKLIYATGAILIAAVSSYAFWPTSEQAVQGGPSENGSNPAIVEIILPDTFSDNARIGKLAFEAKCASCHGINAVGQEGVAPPLVHQIYKPNHHGDESVNGGVKTCQRGGVKVGQFGARALERAALK